MGLSPAQWALLARALGADGKLRLRDGNAERTAGALQRRGLLARTDEGDCQATLAGLQALLARDRHSPARCPGSARPVLAKLATEGTFDPPAGAEWWAADLLVSRGSAIRRPGGLIAPTPLGRQQGARELTPR